MKIVLAFDSYKGCLTSGEVAATVSEAICKRCPSCQVVSFPLSDGGEGLLEALVESTKGQYIGCPSYDPLMRPLASTYGCTGDGQTAIIEMASCSGLNLLTDNERNPLHTTTYGTGIQIAHALSQGFRRFIIGLGGSATCDAGMGMLAALGYQFFDSQGNLIPHPCGQHLSKVHRIDASHAHAALHESTFLVACDVNNPLHGVQGAAHIFAPQKGANAQEVKLLDKGLQHIGRLFDATVQKAISMTPGSGAAGGMGAALITFLRATLTSGSELVLDTIRFEEAIADAQLIITGEGHSDAQTLMGKLPFGVLNAAKKRRVPVVLMSGSITHCQQLLNAGFHQLIAITPPHQPLAEAILPDQARLNLINAVKKLSLIL